MTFWRATSHVFEEEKNAMWKQYRRKGLAEMRPYIPGEDLTGITISEIDLPPEDGGMLGRNPQNHEDQWYVAPQYFLDDFIRADFEEMPEEGASHG